MNQPKLFCANMTSMTDLELKIYQLVRQIPRGKVCTYKIIAQQAGNEKLARVVGNVMHKNPLPYYELARQLGFSVSDYSAPDFAPVPCHRVVNSSGKMGSNFGLGGPQVQSAMLQSEGVTVQSEKVNLSQFLWQ